MKPTFPTSFACGLLCGALLASGLWAWAMGRVVRGWKWYLKDLGIGA